MPETTQAHLDDDANDELGQCQDCGKMVNNIIEIDVPHIQFVCAECVDYYALYPFL